MTWKKIDINVDYYEMIDNNWVKTETNITGDGDYLLNSVHKRIIGDRIYIVEKVNDKLYNIFKYDVGVYQSKVRNEKLNNLL